MSVSRLSDWVNPLIGTSGMGHTFPGACAPFGLVQLSPDTDTIPHNVNGRYQAGVYGYCAGYRYEDPTIVGFSHTHLSGTGHSDLGDLLIQPQTGKLCLNPGTTDNPDSGYRSRFSHSTEKVSAGYY
ncbi:MAG: glycoside hydrolase family 92 protein, partial [Bacteroidaceae bacterium]